MTMGKHWNQPQYVVDAIKKRQMGKGNSFYGKHHTEKHKKRISRLLKGRKKSAGFAEKIAELKKGNKYWLGRKHTEKTKKQMSESAIRNLTPELIRTRMRRRTPTSYEKKFMGIITKHCLPYRFVGNGTFTIENLNPDFINTNGQKIAIEVYATYHKKKHTDSIEDWKSKRSAIFANYGWKVLYFDDDQIDENCVLKALTIG